MHTNIPSNNNYYVGEIPKRPTTCTPRNMLKFANAAIEFWEKQAEKNGTTEFRKFYYLNRIKLCKEIKVDALKFMTEGYKHDDIVTPR